MCEDPHPTENHRVAVIAIHGVGDHAQFDTAREIGDLLCNLEYNPYRTPRYSPFTETTKRIHVRPVKVDDPPSKASTHFNWAEKTLQKMTWGPLHAIAKSVFKGNLQVSRQSTASDNSANSLDHLFMKGQLVGFKATRPEDTYECLCLEGKRVPPARESGSPKPQPTADTAGRIAETLTSDDVKLPPGTAAEPGTQEKLVHIYEMYWADLSRLSNAFTQIFGELYQLLFHLGAVSVNNVLAAAIHFQGKEGARQWQLFARAQGTAAAILAWPIPILSLFMAAFAPSLFLLGFLRFQRFSLHGEFVVLDSLLAFLGLAGSAFLLGRISKLNAWFYALPIPLLGGLCVVAAFLRLKLDETSVEAVLAVLIAALSFGGVWFVIRAYEKRRPGSLRAAAYTAAAFALALVIMRLLTGAFPAGLGLPTPAIAMCLNCIEAAFGLLTLSWFAFYFAYAWAHLAGGAAVRASRSKSVPLAKSTPQPEAIPQPELIKARRARWTAQLVLALSSVIFIVMTLCVWTGIISLTEQLLPPAKEQVVKYEPVGAVIYNRLWQNFPEGIRTNINRATFNAGEALESLSAQYMQTPPAVADWADNMLSVAGIGLLPLFLGAIFLSSLLLAWALWPSVADEIRPPAFDLTDGSDESQQKASRKLEKQSVAKGIWLTRGFTLLRVSGEILYWTMWLPPFLFVFLNLGFVFWKHDLTKEFSAILGTLVTGTALGIFGLAGRFKSVAGAFRPLVRVLLDVDNWLREHPRDSNPTARICGRYVSLLRYISAWRDPKTGCPYDALVIIAHSQGTVITADFLRFLKVESSEHGSAGKYDPELALLDKLPISLFTMGCPLHQLYSLRFPHLYGWARDDSPTRRPGKVPDIGANDAPRPESAGIARWVNAYRSGDYVGRYLWRGGDDASYDWHPIFTSYDKNWDPPIGLPDRISADKAGKRIEFSIGPGAHTHYWDHTAGLVAEVLDRLINEVRTGDASFGAITADPGTLPLPT